MPRNRTLLKNCRCTSVQALTHRVHQEGLQIIVNTWRSWSWQAISLFELCQGVVHALNQNSVEESQVYARAGLDSHSSPEVLKIIKSARRSWSLHRSAEPCAEACTLSRPWQSLTLRPWVTTLLWHEIRLT